MLTEKNVNFSFAYRNTLPVNVASRIWQRWNSQSTWQEWDKSISGTFDGTDSITIGQQFYVVPYQAPRAIKVTVVSLVEGIHFTTVATVKMGLLAFGHTIINNGHEQTVILEHSICAVPNDAEIFRSQYWGQFQQDIATSVETLSLCVLTE